MKYIKYYLLGTIAMSNLVFAGGDIDTPIIIEDELITNEMVSESSNFYAGLALSAVSTRESGSSLSFTSEKTGQDILGNATLFAGYDFNEYVAVEGRYSASFTKEASAKMSGFSIFVKPQYPVSDEFSIYGLVGYGLVNIDNTNSIHNVDVNEKGFQWGLGASYAVTEDISISLDYTLLGKDMDGRFLRANSADIDAITLGIQYRF